MSALTYLVFGDLHGRVLPAFRLAMAWGREHGVPVEGLLQVGDLGYFPDLTRLDRATIRHASEDPLELGVRQVTEPSAQADALFLGEEPAPRALWFVAGNHEDFEALAALDQAAGPEAASFPVDEYRRLWCLRDGAVATLPGGLRVGALWGIDTEAPRARRDLPPGAALRPRSVERLAASAFGVLLTHESPRDAVRAGAGSEAIGELIRAAQPAFAFFGHYGRARGPVAGDFGRTQVLHLCGLELRRQGACAEPGSVGALTWDSGAGSFAYLEEAWLRTFTRHNWENR
jgi:hypothetical protein